MISYRSIKKQSEDKIEISVKIPRTLKELGNQDLDELQPSQIVREEFKGFINDASGIGSYIVDKILQRP